MFDIGWMEILVIAVVAVVVIGPQELPRVLANMGRWVTKGRAVAREFQDGVQAVIREAELEDLQKDLRVDMPDSNSIFGENPITQGKSIVGGNDPIPEEQFIDDKIIAEMEEADERTVETLRKITSDAAESGAETNVENEDGAYRDEGIGSIAGTDQPPEPGDADKPGPGTKMAADT